MSDTNQTGRLAQLEAENEKLRRMLDHRGMPRALRHQVRNALAMVRAILRRSAASKDTVEDFAAHLEGRFDALLRIQTMLIANPGEDADLHALIANELAAGAIQVGDAVSLDGPAVRIPPRTAEFLGLSLHELVTNALKFGVLTTPHGRIAVAWDVTGQPRPRLGLTWTETGFDDLAPDLPARGFGMEAIERMLPYELAAETEVRMAPQGLRCSISLPLPSA